MNILNRPAIKSEAKHFIGTDTKWFKMFLATVIIYLVSKGITIGYDITKGIQNFGIQYFNDYYYQNNGTNNGVSVYTAIVAIVLIPFTIAMAGYYLNHIRGFNPDWRSLYKEGLDNYGQYFTVGILTSLSVFLWTLLFIIPGIVKAYAYSQVSYVIHDNKNLSSGEAKKISDIMTNGYKSDLFVLDLSFILWYMLIGITAGIAAIYVMPYVNTVRAMYYENLKKNAIDSGLVAPEAFGMISNPYQAAPADNNQPQATVYTGYENQNNEFVPVTSEDTFNPDVVDEAIDDEKTAPTYNEDVSGVVTDNTEIDNNEEEIDNTDKGE